MLDPAGARRHDQPLAERMRVPCRASAALEGHAGRGRARGHRRVEQRLDADRAGEVLDWPLAGRLRAASRDRNRLRSVCEAAVALARFALAHAEARRASESIVTARRFMCILSCSLLVPSVRLVSLRPADPRPARGDGRDGLPLGVVSGIAAGGSCRPGSTRVVRLRPRPRTHARVHGARRPGCRGRSAVSRPSESKNGVSR